MKKTKNQIVAPWCAWVGILLALLFTANVSAKGKKLDSLMNVLKSAKEDTNKVNLLDDISRRLIFLGKYHKGDSLANVQIALAEKLNDKKLEASGYNTLGLIAKDQDKPKLALDMFNKALALREAAGLKKEVGSTLNNIGLVYEDLGENAKSLETHFKALKIREEIKDTAGMSFSLGNIGMLYRHNGNYVKALDFALRALKLQEAKNDKRSMGISLVSIGSIYDREKEYDKALDYYSQSLKIAEELKDKHQMAISYGDLALEYQTQKNYPKAIEADLKSKAIMTEFADSNSICRLYKTLSNIHFDMLEYDKALQYNDTAFHIAEKMGDSVEMISSYINSGNIYTAKKEPEKAIPFHAKALALAKKVNDMESEEEAYDGLREGYEKMGDKAKAFEFLKLFYVIRDSIDNKENTKKLVQEQMNYDFDKKQAVEKAEQDKKDALHSEEVKRQKTIIYSVTLGLVLILILAINIFRNLKISKKKTHIIERQKKEVEHQKDIVVEKNKEILDSITYAKRLQDAILPPMNLIKQYLPDSFVLYKPKDIVAGDFYWMERADNKILIAAADCTGHGVPGALVSVVCSNALNRTVKEFGIKESGKILDKVRELVLETFEKSESDVKDGMDVSLCCIDTNTKEVQWSGAYNPLWYVQDNELKEITADKQPIGKQEGQKAFSTHNIKLKKGDIIYLFSDGYADQFGGPKGKKFKYKTLQEKLMQMTSETMEKQREKLDAILEEWKGPLEQIDDVLIMGIRL